ncbi:hydroxymethylglutaryl-CoA reductase [Candidatus Woesearchaeota archaeon]|nr:hydroxymethylglutaryl-CoA reductase [Candidatus Woesearchaeota archaeon]
MATNSSLPEKKILEGLKNGKIRAYELENFLSRAQAVRVRAEFIEKEFSEAGIPAIKSGSLEPEKARGNIENMIGSVQVPLGIAGPLEIKGSFFRGRALIPLATTEGALVASVNRGCSALNKSGGVKARIVKTGQTRAPLMKAESPEAAASLIRFLQENYGAVKKIAEQESRFLKLKGIEPFVYDSLIWLRMSADTGDAMGMNMISIAAQNVCIYLEGKVSGIRYLSVSGNLCVDKKPSSITLREGRGRHVVAGALLKGDVVRDVLKSTPEDMENLNIYKNIIGSSIAGSYGLNSHFANVVAAVYLATGQDMAHVVEGSHGVTWMERQGNSLKVSVSMPAIQVGTVGGGTRLPAQQECISLIGIRKSGNPGENASQLAEVVASGVLAGEISLLAAHSSRQLVDAHRRLNR